MPHPFQFVIVYRIRTAYIYGYMIIPSPRSERIVDDILSKPIWAHTSLKNFKGKSLSPIYEHGFE